jgi:hypothetical protein
MNPYVSSWLSTLETDSFNLETNETTAPLFPVWSLYTNCLSLLSKQQSNLADTGFPPEIVNSLKDESIRLRLWGDGYNEGQIDSLCEQFLELKATCVSTLLRIGVILTQR